MVTILDIVDTAVKIGLGALIGGGTSYLITLRTQKHEINRERREVSKELALKMEQIVFSINESALQFHLGNFDETKKKLLTASEATMTSAALSNLLGDDGLVDISREMIVQVDEFYKELNQKNPTEDKLYRFSEEIEKQKKLAYPYIRKAYRAQNTNQFGRLQK